VIVIENVYNAINQISQTTVRNVVGRLSLDQLLSDTASINLQIKNVIDGDTEPWGTQVTAVEIKDIVLPDNMQRAKPPSGRQATRVGTFSPSLVIARGCFLTCVLRARSEDGELSKLLGAKGGGMITAWSVIALSHQHPAFSRPIWSRMAPRLQDGPLPQRQPATPLRNAKGPAQRAQVSH
jgi:hypothetical protein